VTSGAEPDPRDWYARWREGRIAFHEGQPNAALVRHHAELGRPARVFVPFCGKAVDLAWLAEHTGAEILGAELVEGAVRDFFGEHGLRPEVHEIGNFQRYRAGRFTIWAGDMFDLPQEIAPAERCDALYDRAALIALPHWDRPDYVATVERMLTPTARGLLIGLAYDQQQMSGPPFAVAEAEVQQLYAGWERRIVERSDGVPAPRFVERGVSFMQETVYALQRRAP